MDIDDRRSIWSTGFVLLNIGNLFMAMAFYQLIPTLPLYIKEELGGDKGSIGAIMAAFTVSALIIRPFTGIVLDRYGRKWVFVLSLLVFSLMFSGYMLAGSLLAMVVLRLVHGFAWGVTTTSGSTVVVDILPKSKMGEGIGFYGLSMTLAMALGPLIGIWMTRGAHYEWVFIEATVMSLLFFIMAMFVKYPEYKAPKPLPSFTLSVLFEKTALHSSLNMLIIMLPYGGIISFITIFGKEKGLVDIAGPFFIFCAIGIALTRYFAGKIFDRVGPRKLMITGICLEIASFPILSLLAGEYGFYLAALLLGLGVGIAMPTFQAMVNNMIGRDRRGAANSTLFTAIDLGIGLGMVSIGLVGKWLGLDIAFLICTFVCLAGLIYYLMFTDGYYTRKRIL
jgi:MFS family permease